MPFNYIFHLVCLWLCLFQRCLNMIITHCLKAHCLRNLRFWNILQWLGKWKPNPDKWLWHPIIFEIVHISLRHTQNCPHYVYPQNIHKKRALILKIFHLFNPLYSIYICCLWVCVNVYYWICMTWVIHILKFCIILFFWYNFFFYKTQALYFI